MGAGAGDAATVGKVRLCRALSLNERICVPIAEMVKRTAHKDRMRRVTEDILAGYEMIRGICDKVEGISC